MLHWFLMFTTFNPNPCMSNLQMGGCGTTYAQYERVAMPSQEKCEEVRDLFKKSSLRPSCLASAEDTP